MSSRLVVNKIQDSNAVNVDTTFVTNGSHKAWCNAGLTGNLFDSFNVSTADDDGAGKIGINFTNNFNNATYVPSCATSYGTDSSDYRQYLATNYHNNLDETRTTASCSHGAWESSFGDPGSWAMSFIGDLT